MFMTKSPTEEEMASLILARLNHSKVCNERPVYDINSDRLRLVCPCGWRFTLEPGTN